MKVKFRYIFFVVGLLLILSSYAFFFKPLLSLLLVITGFLLTAIAFFLILCFDNLKRKIVFAVIIAIFFVLKHPAKDWLVTQSYDFILTEHEQLFAEANKILISKKANISFPAFDKDDKSIFTPDEMNTLNIFLKTTKVIYIQKNEHEIFYAIWGIPLEMDYGVFYFYSGFKPTNHFSHIKGNWYFD